VLKIPKKCWLVAGLTLGVLLLSGCAGGGPGLSQVPLPGSNNETNDLRLGDTALNSGSLEMASSLYEKTLKGDPKSLEATLGLANVALRTGDLERARLIFLRAQDLAPTDIDAKIGLARVAVRQRHFDEAIALYHKTQAIQPDNSTAAAGLGTALDMQGHHAEAQAVYRQALLEHPDAQPVRVDLGLSLVLDQKPREGAEILLQVANLPDAPPEARQDLALAFGLIGNIDAAKQILARDLPPANVNDDLRFYAAVRQAYAESPGTTSGAESMKAVLVAPAEESHASGTAGP